MASRNPRRFPLPGPDQLYERSGHCAICQVRPRPFVLKKLPTWRRLGGRSSPLGVFCRQPPKAGWLPSLSVLLDTASRRFLRRASTQRLRPARAGCPHRRLAGSVRSTFLHLLAVRVRWTANVRSGQSAEGQEDRLAAAGSPGQRDRIPVLDELRLVSPPADEAGHAVDARGDASRPGLPQDPHARRSGSPKSRDRAAQDPVRMGIGLDAGRLSPGGGTTRGTSQAARHAAIFGSKGRHLQ